MNTQELIEQLAEYRGVEVTDIMQSTFNPNLFVIDGSEEWLVYETEQEAEDAAVEQVKNLLDSEGISFLNWKYMSADIADFVDTEWFETTKREFYEQYVEEIRDEWADDEKTRLDVEMENAGCETEEDFIDYLCNSCSDSIEWFRSNFGNAEVDSVAINHPEVVDIDKLAQYVVDTDGAANTLASYDGEEVELYNCYAYRVD